MSAGIRKEGWGIVRRAHRLDSNHAELVKAFEKLGCSVLSLAGLGSGAPDICVGFGGLQLMCELKDSAKPPSARKLTPDEERFRMNWTGGYKIVEDEAGVLETVETLKRWHRAIRLNPVSNDYDLVDAKENY